MVEGLHIIVACTDRKRGIVPAERLLRSIPIGPTETRMEQWKRRLADASPLELVQAVSLYSGPQWSASVELYELAKRIVGDHRVKAWVASAGYGLIGFEEQVASYGATFSREAEDYVGSNPRDWWRLLGRGSRSRRPRSVEKLARLDPDWSILVAVSATYATAMTQDLVQALRVVGPDKLLVTTAMTDGQRAAKEMDELRPCLLPVTARIRMVEPSAPKPRAMSSILAAQQVVASGTWNSTARAAKEIDRIISNLPKETMPVRKKSSDIEVRRFIRRRLKEAGDLSKTRLLREYRALGKACEQSRFGSLYDEEK